MSNFGPHAVKSFAINRVGRDLVVGDVHGCFTKLRAALDAVGFDPAAGDRLFSVGDLVDRGSESAQVLEWLDRLHAVKGNHEAMVCEFASGHVSASMYGLNGGAWFIGMTPAERQPFIDAFEALPVAIEVMTPHGLVGLVHADCPMPSWTEFVSVLRLGLDATLDADRIRDMALWSRRRIDHGDRVGVADVSAVIVGHTPLEQATYLGNVAFIDTGGWWQNGATPKPLTLLDLATLQPAVAPGAKPDESAPEML